MHYAIAPPPAGFDSWDDFYRSIGVPDDELGIGADRIEDPAAKARAIWFQVAPRRKTLKNRLHIDVQASGGRGSSLETRRERVEAEAARLVALGATRLHTKRRGGPRPLRRRPGRPRGQRVRHQLTTVRSRRSRRHRSRRTRRRRRTPPSPPPSAASPAVPPAVAAVPSTVPTVSPTVAQPPPPKQPNIIPPRNMQDIPAAGPEVAGGVRRVGGPALPVGHAAGPLHHLADVRFGTDAHARRVQGTGGYVALDPAGGT